MTERARFSSGSMPSLRATVASSTSWVISACVVGSRSPRKAMLNQRPSLRTSAVVEPATAAPHVPPKTRISGGSRTTASGLEPSSSIIAISEPTARPIPSNVAGTMAQSSDRPGETSAGVVPGSSRR